MRSPASIPGTSTTSCLKKTVPPSVSWRMSSTRSAYLSMKWPNVYLNGQRRFRSLDVNGAYCCPRHSRLILAHVSTSRRSHSEGEAAPGRTSYPWREPAHSFRGEPNRKKSVSEYILLPSASTHPLSGGTLGQTLVARPLSTNNIIHHQIQRPSRRRFLPEQSSYSLSFHESIKARSQ